MLKMGRKIVAGVLLCLIAAFAGAAEIPEGYYACPLQWDDTLLDVATDVSFLNHKPAGSHGRVVVEEGHFYTTTPHERIRFLGIGIGGDALFSLDAEDMEKIAVRLAKAGVNVVRFHGFDGTYQPYSLIDVEAEESSAMKPEHLDKMFRMFSELRKQGIYSVIGALRMVRALKPGDGVPEVKSYRERRYADRFDAIFIESQKKWAHQLLGTVNPYTGMTLAEDPALLAVEINNESSMLYENKLDWFRDLHPFYQQQLQKKWNLFLQRKYSNSDAALRQAWGGSSASAVQIPEISLGRWRTAAKEVKLLAAAGTNSDGSELICEISGSAANAWDRQVRSGELTELRTGESYIFSCEIAHSGGGQLGLSLQQMNAPFNGCGLNRTLELPAGKSVAVEIGFEATACGAGNPPALNWNVGKCPGRLEIRNIHLVKGMDSGLSADQTLGAGNIPLPFVSSPGKENDWREFLISLECDYVETMRSYLRNDLKLDALLTDTQINWPGVSSVESQRRMDYVDVHSYWGHPRFLGKAAAWDFVPGNWVIEPATSVIPALAEKRWWPLEEASRYRIWNKPLVVSETDYPYPHLFASEMMPIFATVFCRQDWDALNLFIHGRVPGTRGTEGINHMFDQTNHPGKIGFFPAAALIYRTGMIAPAPRSVRLLLPKKVWEQFHSYESAWGRSGFQRDPLQIRSAVVPNALPEGANPVAEESGSAENDAPVRVFGQNGKFFFSAAAPGCGILIGPLGGEQVENTMLKTTLENFAPESAAENFAAAVVVARDGKPLPESESILLTLGSSFINHDVVMSPEGNTIAALRSPDAKWWGSPPVVGVRISGKIQLRCAPGMRAWLLDSCGKRIREMETVRQGNFTELNISPEDETIFYEIAVR